eukprot:3679434-Amphidinium_carterae.1
MEWRLLRFRHRALLALTDSELLADLPICRQWKCSSQRRLIGGVSLSTSHFSVAATSSAPISCAPCACPYFCSCVRS